MKDETFPVMVRVQRSNGSLEDVRVGSAVRTKDGFRLSLGELSIGATPDSPGAAAPARRAASRSGDSSGMVFPPYGRSKGAPIAGASIQDLEFYINGCRRTLDDPAKSRWHEKERVLLAALEAELARAQGVENSGGGFGSSSGRGDFDDEVPPPSDEDIPF
ncbi:MAG TPA: hypothetical protein VJV78_22800 [Polyangiales bacterium]|nr:hypothetical protein [Polyangiales bacterium]